MHLTPEEFVDAAEGSLSSDRLRHVERCEACGRQVSALREVMREAGQVPVPEPSPLFWEQLSARVRHAVAAEAAPERPWWATWLRWPALVPLGALAALVLAMVATVPRGSPVDTLPAPAAFTSTADDPPVDAIDEREWSALAELVGPLDWDAAEAAGLTLSPGDTELAVHELSDEERRELSRLIAGELTRAKS